MRKWTIVLVMVCFVLFPSVVGASGRKSKMVYVRATGYCPCSICCGKYANGITATGSSAYKAGVAIDPKAFSFGTRFDIPGYERGPNQNGSWIPADDTGSAMRKSWRKHGVAHIDVRFKTHKEALKWGDRKIKVRVWYP